MTDFADHNDEPLWRKRREFEKNEVKIERLKTEREVLKAADSRDSQERRRADTRRKLLTGRAIDRHVAQNPKEAEEFVRPILRRALRGTDLRLFGLDGPGPLIPVPVSKPPDAGTIRRADRMSPEERKTRLEEIDREMAELVRRRGEMQARDRGSAKPADPEAHGCIVLGGTFLGLARDHLSEPLDPTARSSGVDVEEWLRPILDRHLTAKRDRLLFNFGAGPLVDEFATPQTRRRRPVRASVAKPDTRDGDLDPEAARRVTDGGTSDGSRAPAGGGSQAAGESAKGAAHATAGDDEVFWKPCRIPAAETSSGAGNGKPDRVWGARLDGVSAVAKLPRELVDTMITIESSGGKTWRARVAEVIQREEKYVVVRRDDEARKDAMEG